MSDQREIELRRKTVGAFLRQMRLEKNVTQLDVAQFLNYSTPQFVSNWERGIAMPPVDVLPKICAFLDIEPSALIDVVTNYQRQAIELDRQRLIEVFASKKS